MTTTSINFDAARFMIMEGSHKFVLVLLKGEVDAMEEPEWLGLREEAREYGLELEIDDDGDAIARAR